jgi:C4-type Zn-finger protein
MLTKEQKKLIENCEMCPECLEMLDEDEDLIWDYEIVPYGSTTARYPVLIEIRCSKCGYREQI